MNNDPQRIDGAGSYRKLLIDGGFQGFLWTQFLGAFNDNVYKMIVSIMAVAIAADRALGARYLAIAGAVFVIPFLTFAGHAGQVADRFSKTRVLQVTKSFEIVIMLLGIVALISHRIEPLLLVLFLLAVQANFFSPAKYGILPEMVSEAQLSRANGLLELSTFVAIVIGTSFGTFLYEHWKDQPVRMGAVLTGIAIVGMLASLRIPKTPAAGSSEPFHWNPFAEVMAGARTIRGRRPLWLTVFGISWFWFVGGLFQMSLLMLGSEVLHVSEVRVGLLMTALAAGIGLGSIAAGSLSGDHIELGLVPAGCGLMGVFSIALGMTASYPWALVWLVAIGFSGGLFAVPLNAFLQDAAGAAEKGRILATNNFVNMVGVILASAVLWFLHDTLHWNAGRIIFALGFAMLAGTLYALWLLPDVATRFFLLSALRLLFRVRIEGVENLPADSGALIVSNHVSFADAVLIGSATPRLIRFLMWAPYYNIRGLRFFFRLLHAIPVATDSPKRSIRALRTAREELQSGQLVGIFPEGSITRTGEVDTFQRGFERVVDGTGVPIIPVFIDGMFGHPLSAAGGRVFSSWQRPWRRTVTVRIGAPIPAPVSAPELRQLVLDLSTSQTSALPSLQERFGVAS